MTRYILLPAIVLLLLLGACIKHTSSGQSGTGTGTGNKDSPVAGTPIPDTFTTNKKGGCFSVQMNYGTWYVSDVSVQPFWYYNWATPLPSPALQNCEFVSMFWGPGNMIGPNLQAVTAMKSQGQIKYVLGFNEPDQSSQSNMTVSQALSYWPQLESLGIPLGSPATSYPTVQWFTDFMDSVAAEKLRVDFICVHMYVGTDDNNFVQVLQSVYNQYHLPIWITEFGTADWNAQTPADNSYTPAEVLGFMQRLLPRLDSLNFVQRYSWFPGDPTNAAQWVSALVDSYGQLTPLGTWYANYKPNTSVQQ